MSLEVMAASLAAVAALAALYFNWRSTKAAMRAAKAAEEQTEIQRQLRQDAAQPFVWVDIRPDHSTGTLLNLVVGNSGPTVATNVRVASDSPIPRIEQMNDRVAVAEATLLRGIASLPPGRTYVWTLGQGFALLGDGISQAYTFTVNADGPFGPIPMASYTINLADLHEVVDRPVGSLHELTRAVRDLTKEVHAVQGSAISRSDREASS